MANIGQRLNDPRNVAENGKELAECQAKIAAVMTRMFRQPKNGGNPFLFSLTAPKPHELCDNLSGQEIRTAATDGKRYYWNPKFLQSLSHDEATVVMEHESYHVAFFHSERMRGFNAHMRNVAMDYVVNAVIEVDHERNQRPGQLWGGALGEPIPLAKLLSYIDGKCEIPKEGIVYADKTVHGRSPESIYEEIMRHWDKSPRKCKTCEALSLDPHTGQSKIPKPWNQPCCPDCGAKPDPNGGAGTGNGGLPSGMDGHVDSKVSKQEVQQDVARAAQQASTMRGTVPSEIEDLLGDLIKPQLKFTDIVRSCMLRKVQDAGMKNDWKRFRKRYIGAKPRQYLPKRHTHMPRWLAMLDTSGSMGDDDLTYGISQLQVLGNHSEGYVVPVDGAPHWGGVTPVKKIDDLKRTKVVGRGGTVFDDFFREFPEHLGTDFDVVVIITDGYCGQIPRELRPPCDVVWVVTRGDHKDFSQPFGRVAPLRNHRL
jgi:predicted metal-dependent peptidase